MKEGTIRKSCQDRLSILQVDFMLSFLYSVVRSQMTSTCGKNRKVLREAQLIECVTDVLLLLLLLIDKVYQRITSL